MRDGTHLGKIKSAFFGIKENQLGLHIIITTKGVCVDDSTSVMDFRQVPVTGRNEQKRAEQYANIMYFLSNLFEAAGVSSVEGLVGIPVEYNINSKLLTHWRILTEVI
jgi:hypothetical protein